MPVEPRRPARGGDRGDRRGIGKHEPDPGRRQRRVDRQIRRPGFEHRQNRHDGLGGALQQQRHTPPRAHPMAGQQVRQPVRGLVELPVGHRAALVGQRHRLRACARPARRTTPESTPPAVAGWVNTARLPDLIQPGVLSRIEQIHRRQPPAAGRRSSPPTPAPTARSAPRCWPRRTRRCEIPPPRRSRRAAPASVQRSASENTKSMRAVWVSIGSGVTCRSPKANPAAGSRARRSSARPTSPEPAGDGSG